MKLTDLHCHILPGMDDGSPDFETSVAMAKMALAGGVCTIAATPHSNVEDDDMALRCRVIRHRTRERRPYSRRPRRNQIRQAGT